VKKLVEILENTEDPMLIKDIAWIMINIFNRDRGVNEPIEA
jgi:hypothetical protein